jgi:hypothetical protein
MLHGVMRANHARSRTIIHFGFDAPEAAAELTQGDEQPGSKVRRLRMRLNPSVASSRL